MHTKFPFKSGTNELKLASWNVNGIRACVKKGFIDWLDRECPHVLCLQEIKAQQEQIDSCIQEIPGYKSYFFSGTRKGYSGVALYVHKSVPVESVEEGIGITDFDQEGRTIILTIGDYVIINGYYPNGQRDHNRVPFKLDFSYLMLERSLSLMQKKKKVILCGDFNTAHHSIDLSNPKQNRNTTGFLPEERAFLDEMKLQGFIDIFRHLHPRKSDQYTWWTYRNNCRERNIGWRIDYFFIAKSLLGEVKNCYLQPKVMGSDHCPIFLELTIGETALL